MSMIFDQRGTHSENRCPATGCREINTGSSTEDIEWYVCYVQSLNTRTSNFVHHSRRCGMYYRLEVLKPGNRRQDICSVKRKPTCQFSESRRLHDDCDSDCDSESDGGAGLQEDGDDIAEYSRVRVHFRPLRVPSPRSGRTTSRQSAGLSTDGLEHSLSTQERTDSAHSGRVNSIHLFSLQN
jgi:hypothetical protein